MILDYDTQYQKPCLVLIYLIFFAYLCQILRLGTQILAQKPYLLHIPGHICFISFSYFCVSLVLGPWPYCNFWNSSLLSNLSRTRKCNKLRTCLSARLWHPSLTELGSITPDCEESNSAHISHKEDLRWLPIGRHETNPIGWRWSRLRCTLFYVFLEASLSINCLCTFSRAPISEKCVVSLYQITYFNGI